MTTTKPDLETLHLGNGSHPTREAGVCFNEAAAWLAGEPHSDHPACVAPYLRSYGMRLNDRADDERRQDLKRFIPLVIGTAGDGLDDRRRWLATDRVLRVLLPKWLDRAGAADRAGQLRALAPITSHDTWYPNAQLVRTIRDEMWALRSQRYGVIRAAVLEAVKNKFADAAAVAAAAAAAVAVAVAAAAAAAADDAAADAAAVAAAAAAAVADAAADYSYGSEGYWAVRSAVYDKMRPIYNERYAAFTGEGWADALALYEDLLDPAPAP
ncbi:MAG TPA: hypothetical protein VGH54_21470 [Mycobacterium sp.]|uniref:hypothetical protein n=1 Tax=Mycobacterium sp. TaxID=1785 RepID=UPI002F422071